MKKKNLPLFFAVGIVLILMGFAGIISSIRLLATGMSTTALVMKRELEFHDSSRNVYVEYAVDGVTYYTALPNVHSAREGEEVTIFYDPENPNYISNGKVPVMAFLVFNGFGALFVILAIKEGTKRQTKQNEAKKYTETI